MKDCLRLCPIHNLPFFSQPWVSHQVFYNSLMSILHLRNLRLRGGTALVLTKATWLVSVEGKI